MGLHLTKKPCLHGASVAHSSSLGCCCRCMHQVVKHPHAALAGVGARSWRSTMTRIRSLTAALMTTLALAGCQSVPLNLMGQEKTVTPSAPTSMISPLVEKRETLVATGYAVISVQNHKNPAQQRLGHSSLQARRLPLLDRAGLWSATGCKHHSGGHDGHE